MTPMDIFWIVIWFVVGLFVFQIPGIKGAFKEISDLYSIIPFLLGFFYATWTQNPEMVIGYIVKNIEEVMSIGIIKGFLSSLAYLIGANISRYEQFGKMSPRIIIYILLFFMLWIVLESLV